VDWAVPLENGFVPATEFPAKYRFDVSTQNCNSDYIVFGLTVNSGTQANLVGINNLYVGATPACNGGNPWVAFAYKFSFTGCSNVVGIGGAVNQIPANFTSSPTYTSVDLGSASGSGDCTTGNVHSGTFDNQFWIKRYYRWTYVGVRFRFGNERKPEDSIQPQNVHVSVHCKPSDYCAWFVSRDGEQYTC
jgi:hypothetical protein